MPTVPPLWAGTAGSEKDLSPRMPRLQTSLSAAKSAAPANNQDMAPPSAAPSEKVFESNGSAGHQRFVLTDHVAFRYLEEDPSATVLTRRQQLEGYEIYLVEQWACSRTHPTFLITTYTGDPKDTVVAGVLSVPTDESTWSPQLKLYFKALHQYHARPKETTFGTLMITNLSSFPSSLTVILVPEGDIKKHRELFFVNENLKRLGCSGRSGIKLAPPSSATVAKFHQLYRTSDKIPSNSAVIELVKLCQVALVMFGKLQAEYADGLLCDITEKAINDWWVEFGAEHYNVEPHDGILGPTSVAALLGMLMGARNRLSAYNAPVAKDVFDIESTKRGIAYFQKSQRIQKTRRLDRQTLERLRRATAKAASKEGWAVPRALKSTVAELGGKGGEMVMGMVGAGDKAGIADIETVDIDRFIELVQGERPKWLWYGKPRKTQTGDMFKRLPGEDETISLEEQRSHAGRLLKRETTFESHNLSKQSTHIEEACENSEGVEKEREPTSKRAVIKRATDKIESGSGFSRLKDAVGRRNHQQKSSKDENGRLALHYTKSDLGSPQYEGTNGSTVPALQSRPGYQHLTDGDSFTSARRSQTEYDSSFAKALTETPRDSASTLAVNQIIHPRPKKKEFTEHEDSDLSRPPTIEPSIAGSIYHGIDLAEKLPFNEERETPLLLRRTQSSDQLAAYRTSHRNDDYWPRHLSFSIAEESILIWPSIILADSEDSLEPDLSTSSYSALQAAYSRQLLLTEEAKRLHSRLLALRTLDSEWVSTRLNAVQDLDAQADTDIQELEDMYYQRYDSYQRLREDAHEILSGNRAQLQEGIRDLETLGAKLDYEIHTLRSKVDDVDDGVNELEKQVELVEERIRELDEVVGKREGWLHWGFRLLTGIGQPPG
ncbi:Sin3 complex subunit [Lojkania enalia]|uniref:Sin3 complex subunit n=1 Tax=Lojkania enalia TaxID=147567 RepID=A0A9P4N950_9PLEO|nr:Sin3 complex subunit [Didymosphaeria enalia]